MSTERGWLSTFAATYVANLKAQFRYYSFAGWLAAGLLGPIFLLASAWVVSHFVAGGPSPPRFLETAGYPDYLSFVLLGLAFNGLAMSAFEDGGSAVYDEESQGTWDLVALTPMNRFVWMFAKTLAGLTAALLDFVLVLLVGAYLVGGLAITTSSVFAAVAGVLLTLLALQGFGFLMAAAGLVWKQPHALAILLAPFAIFFSGMMFPISALPPWAIPISEMFPLTHGITVVRGALLLGQGLGSLARPVSLLVATGAAYMVVGYLAFRAMERRALRQGVLGRY